MRFRTYTVVLIVFFTSFSSYAQDEDRIDRLEQEIKDLTIRVLELETILQLNSSESKIEPSDYPWKSQANWRTLSTGMSKTEVRGILGEPMRIDGGDLAIWYYENNGRVYFYGESMDSWSEPR